MNQFINNVIIEFLNENKQSYLTVYHGTNTKFVNDIKANGLIDKTGYNQGWYMLSTDFESALYHATPQNEEDVTVFEFKIPLIDTHYWEGYPYLWKGEKRNDNSTWYALMQQIPNTMISNVITVPYDRWVKQKNDKF